MYSYKCTLSIIPIFLHVTTVLAAPSFDPTAIFRNILIPADAAVNSIIYRLRASDPDFDYPLKFEIDGEITIASVDSLNCTAYNSVCQANVILMRKLEAGRFYDFRVKVTSAKRRRSATMECSFRATNATTPIAEIFPGAPTLLMVSERARRNMELGSLIARGNRLRQKAVLLELWGSPQFGLRQRIVGQRDAEGTIILLGQLDYENTTVHHLTILANDPWAQPDQDTRNIAAWPILVAVIDEQDTPPVFVLAPPTTQLSPDLQPGDVILKVQAEDGDRGIPRDIRYGLVPEGNPFVQFFNLSEETGELRLAKPVIDIQSISHSNIPIILTVVAEEVRSNAKESPAQSSTVKLALIPPPLTSPSPYFNKQSYQTTLDENSPIGTQLDIDLELIGTTGTIYSLKLENNNGTFDVIPNVIEGRSKFVLKVRDNSLLDYEKYKSLGATLVAQELGEGNASSKVELEVDLKDVNDNAPDFMEKHYHAQVLENAESGTAVINVLATDKDRRSVNIRYSLEGTNYFSIDEQSGVVTVKNSQALDAESLGEHTFNVIAIDTGRNQEGKGLSSTAQISVNLLDVNDQEPTFDKPLYEFILDRSRKQFTVPAFIHAYDNDQSPPNNEVRYELIGNLENLTLDTNSGELQLTGPWNYNEVIEIKARAYDNGVPRLWSECEIRLYPPENAKTYMMMFVVSGTNPNRRELEDSLSKLIGGKVTVNRIRPYTGDEPHVLDVSEQRGGEKSIAETTVTYESANSVLDIERIKHILHKQEEESSKLKVASTGAWNLWWLLLILLLLILLTCLILALCCILEGCPLYVPPKKRRRRVTPVDIEKVVLVKDEAVKETDAGPPAPPPSMLGQQPPAMENRSVQVAEWFGRREAWTPEHNEDEIDSIRRHEMDRGSERGRKREYYIREGGADILRLVTRDARTERPVTLLPEQTYVLDGKDSLMRRYIEQQQQQLQQSTLNRIQSEHELLEESLRQQNALLRQILLERERDLRLETQSLPAGTQTDHHASTQTEFVYLRPPARQTRSDNDASSDDDDHYNRKRRAHKNVKRKIRTPIQEESEHEQYQTEPKSRSNGSQTSAKQSHSQKRSHSIIRQTKVENVKSSRRSSSNGLKKEILQEISDSLNQTETEEEEDPQLEDSLEYTSPDAERTNSGRRRSENDIPDKLLNQSINGHDKSYSTQDLTRLSLSRASNSSQRSRIPLRKKSSARYMEWYKPNTGRSSIGSEQKSKLPKPVLIKKAKDELKTTATKVSKKTTLEKTQKHFELPTAPGPEHPLIQHSKNRFESAVTMPPSVKQKDTTKTKSNKTTSGNGGDVDVDSGIALTRPAKAQKKSVFTIAYDDMATKQLPESISTTP